MWLRRVKNEALAPPMRIRRESVEAYWEEDGHIKIVLHNGWEMAVAGNIEEFDEAMGVKKKATRKHVADISPDDMDDFEEFWRRYPRKVAKQAARKAWQRSVDERPALGVILCELDKQVKTWKTEARTDDKIPHPSTWIRGARWTDVVKRNGLHAVSTPSVKDMLEEIEQLDRRGL